MLPPLDLDETCWAIGIPIILGFFILALLVGREID